MNHSRTRPNAGEGDTYFSHLGVMGEPFDATRAFGEMPSAVLVETSPVHGGRDLDYQGVELMNAENMIRYRRTRADWLLLLLRSEPNAGTANSGSHRLGRIIGLPRTYVGVSDDALDAVDPDLFMDSLRAGRAFGMTGPIVTAHFDDAALGDVHSDGTATLYVTIDAAPRCRSPNGAPSCATSSSTGCRSRQAAEPSFRWSSRPTPSLRSRPKDPPRGSTATRFPVSRPLHSRTRSSSMPTETGVSMHPGCLLTFHAR